MWGPKGVHRGRGLWLLVTIVYLNTMMYHGLGVRGRCLSRTYCGVRGYQRSLGHEKVKPHVECSSRLPSFGCFEPLLGLFWAKNGCFWPKTAQIWEGTSGLGATAPGRHR